MYQEGVPAQTAVFSNNSWYVYFQVQENRTLKGVEFLGHPLTGNPLDSGDQIRWQLFQTTFDWQTPNGNDDRLFYGTTFSPQNLGLTNYLTPVFDDSSQSLCGSTLNEVGNCPPELVLQKGSYYFLSLQITGPDIWLVQSFEAGPGAFTTADGFFSVVGYNPGPVGPGSQYDLTLSLVTENIPEPASLALLGAGLAGLANLRRRKKLRLTRDVHGGA